MSRLRLGLVAIATGAALALGAQLSIPRGVPLYDGVVPNTPYLWLDPPEGHPGGAKGATASIPTVGGRSDLVAVATPEFSPQAQIFAIAGGLQITPGATSVEVSIQPVEPVVPPPDGYVDGNVYRFSITDQAGHPLDALAGAQVSVTLRSADPTLAFATIEEFDGTKWTSLKTFPPASTNGPWATVVTTFGDFAVVGHGTSPYETAPPTAAPSEAATTAPTAEPAATEAAPSTPTATPTPGGPTGTSGGPPIEPIAIGAVLLGLLAAMVALDGRRRRRPKPPGPAVRRREDRTRRSGWGR